MAATTDPMMPPMAPSTDFLGEMRGAILWLPNARPTKYAKVSFTIVQASRRMVRAIPWLSSRMSRMYAKPMAIQTMPNPVSAILPTR